MLQIISIFLTHYLAYTFISEASYLLPKRDKDGQ